ncbi:uncharacterized protein PpBr36_06500 [Pyricularia pennisetigena]|uniref:uncharacterized protein n=1 Tax=Pyricularia pennisetigena TaxID=1578925 RepID=UPI0011508149|nr:uncharacterized protein PpBr36_06500 [Pyricularia pennisetigena]TLS23401.1 hypothetical protein PpBr36_06500 [Pyricularia pennisetigena]
MGTEPQNFSSILASQVSAISPSRQWAPKKKRAFKNVDLIPRIDKPIMSSPTAKRDHKTAQSEDGRPWDHASLRTSHLDKKPFKTNQDDIGDETLKEDFEGSTMVEDGEVKEDDGSHEDPQMKSSRGSA